MVGLEFPLGVLAGVCRGDLLSRSFLLTTLPVGVRLATGAHPPTDWGADWLYRPARK